MNPSLHPASSRADATHPFTHPPCGTSRPCRRCARRCGSQRSRAAPAAGRRGVGGQAALLIRGLSCRVVLCYASPCQAISPCPNLAASFHLTLPQVHHGPPPPAPALPHRPQPQHQTTAPAPGWRAGGHGGRCQSRPGWTSCRAPRCRSPLPAAPRAATQPACEQHGHWGKQGEQGEGGVGGVGWRPLCGRPACASRPLFRQAAHTTGPPSTLRYTALRPHRSARSLANSGSTSRLGSSVLRWKACLMRSRKPGGGDGAGGGVCEACERWYSG